MILTDPRKREEKMCDRPYQICTRCVMDSADPDTEFDEYGICNHCRNFERVSFWTRGDIGFDDTRL